jgi:thioredoxin 1
MEEQMAAIQTLTDDTFKETVGAAATPMLVDFWAEWCGPCKQIAPILEELAVEQADRLSIGKLNVDENLKVAQEFSVMSIPTLILFKGGEPVARLVGAKPKGALLQELSAYL